MVLGVQVGYRESFEIKPHLDLPWNNFLEMDLKSLGDLFFQHFTLSFAIEHVPLDTLNAQGLIEIVS